MSRHLNSRPAVVVFERAKSSLAAAAAIYFIQGPFAGSSRQLPLNGHLHACRSQISHENQ
jgi:hypothetical protein